MNNKINKLLIIFACSVCGSISSCGSGNSSNQQVSSQAQIQPDGTAVLSDGTRVSMASRIFSISPDRSINTKLKVDNGIISDLGLIAVPVNNSILANIGQQTSSVAKVLFDGKPNDYISNKRDSQNFDLVNIVASNLAGSPIVGVASVNTKDGSMIKASYIDMSATGAVSLIQAAGYKASNVLIFGFADTTSSLINNSYLKTIQTAIDSESTGAVNLLSIGGATGSASDMMDTDTVISNIDTQIKSYNSSLKNGKISGVDLDLEGGFTAEQITALAKGFSDKGYLVSAAPQVYLSSGSNVDSSEPSNIVLTSGSPNSNQSNYNPALSSGYIDYLFVQTYNTPNWTINNYAESQVEFIQAVAKALNNSTKSDCSEFVNDTSTVCIPNTTNLVIGTVANAGGAYSSANIFGVAPGTSYNQASILSQLKLSIDEMIADTESYKYFGGMMMWSLNTDYDPSDYGDSYATVGGFSSEIYGAQNGGGTSSPYFIMQISNTATSNTGNYPYATATLVINGAYYEWGGLSSSGADIALGSNENKSWGTLASSQDSETSSYVTDSNNLDVLFANTSSFTISQLLINTYSDANKTKKGTQYVCKSILSTTTLEAGHSYNVMINPNGACALEKVN